MNPPKPPASFLCPITWELFRDPVVTMDGHTYERKAIASWLRRNRTSPRTNLVLQSTRLIPNCALKGAIAEWRSTNGMTEEQHDVSDSDWGAPELPEFTVHAADLRGAWTDDARYFVRESINDPSSPNPQSLVLKHVWWLDLVGTMEHVSPGRYEVICGIMKQHAFSLEEFGVTVTTQEAQTELGTHYTYDDELAEPEGIIVHMQLGQIELTTPGHVTVNLYNHAGSLKTGVAWKFFGLARIV